MLMFGGKKKLFDALKSDDLEQVKYLLEKKPGLVNVDYYYDKPLHYAIRFCSKDIVKLLISKKADVNGRSKPDNQTPIHYCEKEALLDLLIENGADINDQDNRGETPLHNASTLGRYKWAELLIKKGAKVNIKDKKGETPLYRTILPPKDPSENINYLNIVKLLFESGADVRVINNEGENLLHITALLNNPIIALEFIRRGVEVNAKNNNGNTPLYLAKFNNHNSIAELLIASGAH